MAIGDYTRINFNNGAPPPLNAVNMNKIDAKLDELDDTSANEVFQPLASVAASGANVTYTIPFVVGKRTAYIPAAYLKTAGAVGTLTITTGSGTPLVIPLSASGDTITSGDALIPVYIAPSGSVIAQDWTISGSNDNGSYEKHGNGMMEQFGTKSMPISTTTAYGSIYYGNFGPVPFPVAYLSGAIPTFTISTINNNGGVTWVAGSTAEARTNTGVGSLIIVSATSRTTFSQVCSWESSAPWRI